MIKQKSNIVSAGNFSFDQTTHTLTTDNGIGPIGLYTKFFSS